MKHVFVFLMEGARYGQSEIMPDFPGRPGGQLCYGCGRYIPAADEDGRCPGPSIDPALVTE